MQKDYDQIILNKIEKSFDILMPIGAAVSFVMATLIYIAKAHTVFTFYDITLAIILIVVFIVRKTIPVEAKVLIVLGCTFILGLLALLYRGFTGAGFMLLVTTNIVAVSFLRFKLSIWMNIFSVSAIGATWFLSRTTLAFNHLPNLYMANRSLDWFIQMLTFILFIIVLNVIARANKSYLISNINEIEKSTKVTYNLAYYDQLTQIPNRYMFLETLGIKRRQQQQGYLVIFDMKSFKLINSIHGNEMGDEVLVKVSKTFMDLKGENELVARISGNEFAWWMDGTGKNTIDYRLEYLQEEIYKRLRVAGVEKRVEFYISYAHMPTHGNDIDTCYRKAIIALQYAKANNCHHVIAYNNDIERETRDEAFLRDCLSEGLSKDEFTLVFQEKVDSRTKEVIGLEALARWYSPQLEHVSPADFIPAVERGNLSVRFGNMIIQKALDIYPQLVEKYGEDIKLSINISPSHLIYKGFRLFMIDELSKRNIKPQNIIIEITEDIVIDGVEVINEVLQPLRQHGINISLDDFGSGYSSLNYLSILELDELKIDKTFVDQMCDNYKVQSLLKAIVHIAEAYEIDLVVEGVETIEQVEMLQDIGCYAIQGYYYSKPEPIK